MLDIDKISSKINKFSRDRDWDKYHTPKNLSMALSVEVSELVEIFQWLTGDESKNLDGDSVQSVKEEVADILIYLIRLADHFDINLEEAVLDKIKKNDVNYPIELSKGNAVKYNNR